MRVVVQRGAAERDGTPRGVSVTARLFSNLGHEAGEAADASLRSSSATTSKSTFAGASPDHCLRVVTRS